MLLSAKKRTPTTATLKGIPSGVAGIKATLKVMAKIIKKGKVNIVIRELALSIVDGLEPKCWICEAKAIQSYIYNNIRYVRDVDGVETISTPEKTLEYGQGDCDDMVILASSLLQSIGHPVRLIAVGFNYNPISHVLIETLIGSKWVAMELTVRLPIGVMPPSVTKKIVVNIK